MAAAAIASPERAADASLDSTANGPVSDHTLIGLLQASVDRLNTTVDSQRSTTELQARDEKRMQVMLKLAQEQVQRSRESSDRLQREAVDAKRQLEESEAEVRRLNDAVDGLEAKARVDNASSDRSHRDLQAQLKAERGERATVEATLERVRAELEEAKTVAVTHSQSRDAKYRELYQDFATVKAKCNTQKEEISFLEDQRTKEVRQVAEREYELNRVISQLKQQLGERESEIEALKRAHFEQMTALQSDNELLRVKVIQLEGMLQSTDRDGAQRIQQLRDENRLLRERNETDMLTAQAKEKTLQKETATLTANLRAAQQEINDLADRDAEAKKQSVTDVVKLHAERDSLSQKVASLERQLTELRGKSQAEAVTLRTDAEVTRNERVLAEQKHRTELAVSRDENAKLRDELSLIGQQLADAQAAAKREETHLSSKLEERENELRTARAERDGYKDSAAKLEQHVRDNYAVKILEDEVSSLKAQNVQLKNQITHANSALANLRVEADISESSRMRTMQDQVVEAQRRVGNLEREVRFSRPLLADLVEAAQHAHCLDAALERDVDLFFRQFGHSSA